MNNTQNSTDVGVACRSLVRGLREMSKWGLGPSGGGGTVDDWSSGRIDAEERMRKELRRLLKEFDAANAQANSVI